MQLTSELVHWLVGGLVTVLALLLLWAETRGERPRWTRFLIPAFLLLGALQAVFDPVLHGEAGPGGYELETAQHLVIGLVLLGIGIIEGLRAVGRLQHVVFAWALPAGIAFVGITFLLHSQHDADVPMILLVAQHRVHGATLLVAAVALALAGLNRAAPGLFRSVAFTALLLFGLEFILYTEGNFLFGQPPAGHAGQSQAAASDPHAGHSMLSSSDTGDSPQAAVDGFHAALQDGDADAAARWLAPDVLIFESGGAERSREQYAAHHLQADAVFLKSANVEILSGTGATVENLAWATTESRISGTAKDKAVDIQSNETIVLKKTAGGWRVVHIHWSSAPYRTPNS